MAIFLIEQEQEAVPTWKLYRNGVCMGTIEKVPPPRRTTQHPFLVKVVYGSEASRRMPRILDAGRWILRETSKHRTKMREAGRAKRLVVVEVRA